MVNHYLTKSSTKCWLFIERLIMNMIKHIYPLLSDQIFASFLINKEMAMVNPFFSNKFICIYIQLFVKEVGSPWTFVTFLLFYGFLASSNGDLSNYI